MREALKKATGIITECEGGRPEAEAAGPPRSRLHADLRRHRVLWLHAGLAVLLLVPACTGRGEDSRSHRKAEPKQAVGVLPGFPSRVAGLELDPAETPRRFSADDIWEYIDGGAHEVIRLGFSHLFVACYREPGKERKVYVEAYVMKSAEAAGSLLEAWGSKEAKSVAVCGRSFEEGPLLYWQKGAVYVRLMATFDDETTRATLESLGRGLCPVLVPR
jgi:hypothetical protein